MAYLLLMKHHTLEQLFSTMAGVAIVVPRGHLAMTIEIFANHNVEERYWHLVSRGR